MELLLIVALVGSVAVTLAVMMLVLETESLMPPDWKTRASWLVQTLVAGLFSVLALEHLGFALALVVVALTGAGLIGWWRDRRKRERESQSG